LVTLGGDNNLKEIAKGLFGTLRGREVEMKKMKDWLL